MAKSADEILGWEYGTLAEHCSVGADGQFEVSALLAPGDALYESLIEEELANMTSSSG